MWAQTAGPGGALQTPPCPANNAGALARPGDLPTLGLSARGPSDQGRVGIRLPTATPQLSGWAQKAGQGGALLARRLAPGR